MEQNSTKKGPCLGVRHLQTLLLYLNKVVILINRTHVAVTLVAMTNASKSNAAFPQYNWTEQQKYFILASLFVGNLITQIPSAYLIRRFGVKINLFIITMCVGILNGLVPISLPWGDWQIFCALRLIQGLFESVAQPALFRHLANWSPPAERNIHSGFLYTGIECGAIFAMFLSGGICKSSLGWPGAFYISTLLCFSWCIIWLIFGANTAKLSKCITATERNYIEDALKDSVEFEKKKNLPIPWNALLTSIPLWSLVVARATEEGCYTTVQTILPAYMNGILNVDIMDNALYSALPSIGSFIMTFLFMALAAYINKKKLLTLTSSRKFFNTFATTLPAIGLIWIGFLTMEQKLFVILIITIFGSFSCAAFLGSMINIVEIAPNHTEFIASITEFFAGVAIILGPIGAGFIVTNGTNRYQWQILFGVIAAVYLLGNLVFLFGGTSEIQLWNSENFKNRKSGTITKI